MKIENKAVFDEENLTITVHSTSKSGKSWYEYEVDLEEANTPAEILDWIFQMVGKTRDTISAEALYSFLEEMDQASLYVFGKDIQGTFCPGGKYQRASWKRGTVLKGGKRL